MKLNVKMFKNHLKIGFKTNKKDQFEGETYISGICNIIYVSVSYSKLFGGDF
jgi:hypothetical protein